MSRSAKPESKSNSSSIITARWDQIINGPVKTFLALEWLQPGEGEDTAALRLLRHLPDRYGSRFFDILLLDALYAQAPVFQLAAELGWDLVVSLDQWRRRMVSLILDKLTSTLRLWSTKSSRTLSVGRPFVRAAARRLQPDRAARRQEL